MMRTIGRTFDAGIKIYNGCKYEAGSEVAVRTVVENVTGWEVKTIDRDYMLDLFGEADPCDEYLILYLENGEESTFRNSYCDMFRA